MTVRENLNKYNKAQIGEQESAEKSSYFKGHAGYVSLLLRILKNGEESGECITRP